MNIKISKEADILICLLYKQYCDQRKGRVPKSKAKMFGSSEDIQEAILPKWSPEDVDDTCRELGKAKLLDCFYADDIAYIVHLTDEGIVYMENRFENNFKSLLEYLESLMNILPF